MTDGETQTSEEEKRGEIFTDAQRKFLKGNKSVSQSYENVLWSRIWPRVVGSLKDISLFTELDEKRRWKIYDSDTDRQGGVVIDRAGFDELVYSGEVGVASAYVEFTKFLLDIMHFQKTEAPIDAVTSLMEQTVEEYIEEESAEPNVIADVSISADIETERVNIEKAKKKFKTDGFAGLSSEQRTSLIRAGKLKMTGDEDTPIGEAFELVDSE